MALKGMWGSFFSRKGGAAMRRPFRRFWSRIELAIGEPVPPEKVTAEDLGDPPPSRTDAAPSTAPLAVP
jgi:hypothetical protein